MFNVRRLITTMGVEYNELSTSTTSTTSSELNEINTTSDNAYNRYRYNICFISCCAFIIYFLLTVPTIFMDIIIGFMYRDIYTCPTYPASIKLLNELSINNWLIVNGLMSYLNLMMLVLLTKVYTDNTFFRKLLKYSTYIITIFVLTWTVLGSIIFYKYYYNDVYADDLNNKCPFFYNYLFIRIVLAPLIVILRFVEIYNI